MNCERVFTGSVIERICPKAKISEQMDEVPGAMDRQGDAACSSRNVPVICACNQRYLPVVSRGEKELAADPSFCLQI